MLLLENISHDELKKYIKQFYTYALTRLKKIDRDPKIVFKRDQTNANNFLEKQDIMILTKKKLLCMLPIDILKIF